jgi:HK97 family phage major capsid protein
MQYLKQQMEARQQAWHAAKTLLDAAAAENRDLSAEEEQSYARMMADIDERSQKIADLQAAESRAAAIEAAVVSAPEVRAEVRMAAPETDSDIIRQLAMGERRSFTFERRALNTSDDSAIVPQSFYDVIQENLLYTGPFPDSNLFTVLNTASGEDIKVPVESTRPVGSAVSEGATIGTSEGTFSNVTLRAHKYGTLVLVSRELIEDSGIDLVPFLGRQLGVALGTAINSALTLGTGTVEPAGISASAGSGVTGGTAVSGAFTADNLIDLAHSIDTAYAMRPNVAWMMSRATLGAVRKLKDNQGAYLYAPAATVGSPDTLLGYRIAENPYVAAIGTSAKSVLFGDMSSYHVRQVGGIEVVRSDEAYFTSDQVAFRALIRIDGALGQSGAVKYFQGAAS